MKGKFYSLTPLTIKSLINLLTVQAVNPLNNIIIDPNSHSILGRILRITDDVILYREWIRKTFPAHNTPPPPTTPPVAYQPCLQVRLCLKCFRRVRYVTYFGGWRKYNIVLRFTYFNDKTCYWVCSCVRVLVKISSIHSQEVIA